MLLKFNIEFKQLIIINPEHKKSIRLYLSLKNISLFIFSEIIIETKKNIMLIGKADDKKNTPKRNDFSPMSNLLLILKFFIRKFNIKFKEIKY